MHLISRRKLVVGFAGAAMTTLSIVAVAPAGAQNITAPAAATDQIPIVTPVATDSAGVPIVIVSTDLTGAPITVAAPYVITGYGAPATTADTDPDDRNVDTASTGQDNSGGGGDTTHTVPADQG